MIYQVKIAIETFNCKSNLYWLNCSVDGQICDICIVISKFCLQKIFSTNSRKSATDWYQGLLVINSSSFLKVLLERSSIVCGQKFHDNSTYSILDIDSWREEGGMKLLLHPVELGSGENNNYIFGIKIKSNIF